MSGFTIASPNLPLLQNSEKHRRLEALTHERQGLVAQLRQAQPLQASLAYAYPALAAVQGETGQNPTDIQKVQGRLPGHC